MATPLTLSGELQVPPDQGQPNAPIPFSVSTSFDSKVDDELNLSGAGSKVIDFGTIASPGAKIVLIEVDPSATASPIQIRVNGGGASGQTELSPGGFWAYASPTPLAGITALEIIFITNVKVRVRAFG